MRLAASTVQSRQFFESTLPEELFELKNEETIKKSRETVPLKENSMQNSVVGFRVAGTTAPNG
jgi:hypothetical protein